MPLGLAGMDDKLQAWEMRFVQERIVRKLISVDCDFPQLVRPVESGRLCQLTLLNMEVGQA